ncbi:hypothetical protein VTJ49DRAFT_2026 [Mycothermus thermophilus]|uniref:Mitogen-activated protein kinase-binding protein 1 n=1 Tax=Humicola insolens TaxID=85995 RepID=A0ABR3VC77_HUMIN
MLSATVQAPEFASLPPPPNSRTLVLIPSMAKSDGIDSLEPTETYTRVIGTTCSSPTGFDTVGSSFSYIAGGAVVVVDVAGEHYSQRFFRARPTAVPLLSSSPTTNSSSTPLSTPKATDSRNRAAASPRDSLYPSADWPDSPSSKTWTSRERIKAATCLALSPDGRYLAVGETGYAPRVLTFNLQDASSDVPLVSISEHTFGVKAVAWSPDAKYLASLGSANDGYLYLWKVDPRTGAVKLFQQNRCTSTIRGMVWMGNSLLTLGVRHVKLWRVDDGQDPSSAKSKLSNDTPSPAPQAQKPLPGRNILLGPLLETTFSCALPVSDEKAIICSESGCVCLLDDANKQMRLAKALEVDFAITCIARRSEEVYLGGRDGQLAVVKLDSILNCISEPPIRISRLKAGLAAMGLLENNNFVTIDSRRSIDIWSPDYLPGSSDDDDAHIALPGLGDPVLGIQPLPASRGPGARFFTWSGAGRVTTWDMNGMVQSSLDITVEQIDTGSEPGLINQVVVVKATDDGSLFVAGDKLGVLRIVEASTETCLLETKAHSSNVEDITVYEGKTRFLVASCGKDRTVQLFHRTSTGVFEHVQTLEFTAKVVQVLIPAQDKILTCSLDRTLQIHDVASKEGDPDVIAAITSRVISLRASPSSMVVTPEEKTVFVALLDRSVCQFELATGRLVNSFKCNDEVGQDSVVLESLTYGQPGTGDVSFLLGISNTDKSVRIYDAQTGCFMDREWGHTEAINGVVLIDDDDSGRRIVSVGEDGTIMIWTTDVQETTSTPRVREPSPEKSSQPAATRPPLRRVLSRAELAEFQRPGSSAGTASQTPGRRSPPRTANRKPSKFHLNVTSVRTPTADKQQPQQSQPQLSPTNVTAVDDTPSRRGSSADDSPPPSSPRSTRSKLHRRPSLPALGATPSSSAKSRKSANHHRNHGHGNDRGSGSGGGGGYPFGSLSMATEQTCRQLRAFRRKLASSDTSIHADVLAQLDAELRLTAAALGERAIRSRTSGGAATGLTVGGSGGGSGSGSRGSRDRSRNPGDCDRDRQNSQQDQQQQQQQQLSESLLSGLLDQYSERLVNLLDEKLRVRMMSEDDRDPGRERGRRPSTSGGGDGDGESSSEGDGSSGSDTASAYVSISRSGSVASASAEGASIEEGSTMCAEPDEYEG